MLEFEETKPVFELLLEKNNIPAYQVFYYNKWLRYYLHFCRKYSYNEKYTSSLSLWLEKLKQKKQTEFQQKQAKHAITLFYQLQPPVKSEIKPAVLQPDISNHDITNDVQKIINQAWYKIFIAMESEIKLRHLAKRTLEVYVMWVRRFKKFTGKTIPDKLTSEDAKKFLTYLAVKRKVAGSTQNQAFNALLFLYRHVLKKEFSDLKDTPRAKRIKYIPTVLSQNEVLKVFENLLYPYKLIAQLSYGCGLRSREGAVIRIKDVDLENGILNVRRGKGKKDRTVPLPNSIRPSLNAHIDRVKKIYERDVKNVFAGTFLLDDNENTFKNYLKEFAWYWLFPAKNLVYVPYEKVFRRYFLYPTNFQKALREAINRAGIYKRVTPHTLRHSFATHLLQAGYDIRQVQELLGHSNVQTTMIYLHTARTEVKQPQSPLDFILH